jgi:hypothetical protein
MNQASLRRTSPRKRKKERIKNSMEEYQAERRATATTIQATPETIESTPGL